MNTITVDGRWCRRPAAAARLGHHGILESASAMGIAAVHSAALRQPTGQNACSELLGYLNRTYGRLAAGAVQAVARAVHGHRDMATQTMVTNSIDLVARLR